MKKFTLSSALLAAALLGTAHASLPLLEQDDAARIARAREGGDEGIEALRAELKAKHGVTRNDIYARSCDGIDLQNHDGVFDLMVKGIPFFNEYFTRDLKGTTIDEIYDPSKISFIYGNRFFSMLESEILTLFFQGYKYQWDAKTQDYVVEKMPASALYERLSQAKRVVPTAILESQKTTPIKTVRILFSDTRISEQDFDADDMAYKVKKVLGSFNEPFIFNLACEPFMIKPILRAATKFQDRLRYFSINSYSVSAPKAELAAAPYKAIFKLLTDAPKLVGANLGQLPYLSAATIGEDWQQAIGQAFERRQFALVIDPDPFSPSLGEEFYRDAEPQVSALFDFIVSLEAQAGIAVFNGGDMRGHGSHFTTPHADDYARKEKRIQEVLDRLQKEGKQKNALEHARLNYLSQGPHVITKEVSPK
ncbi:MAG: hypothetical protein ACK5O7_02555 [Holosporales bacterium]